MIVEPRRRNAVEGTALLDQLDEGCQIVDPNLSYVFVNESFARRSQRLKEHMIGRSLVECHPGIERTELFSAVQQCLADRSQHLLEHEAVGPDGTRAWYRVRVAPVREGACLMSLDISEARRLAADLTITKEQLQATQSLEMVRRLAGGIAHDINNVLSVILSYSDFISEALSGHDTALADVEEIRAAGLRAADLTRQLLILGQQQHKQPSTMRAVDLGKLVAGTEKLLRRVLGPRVELTRLSSNRCWPVTTDPGRLEHLIFILAAAARAALPDGSELLIETKNVDLASGPHVALSFTAAGPGLEGDARGDWFAMLTGTLRTRNVPFSIDGDAFLSGVLRLLFPRAESSAEHHPATLPPLSVPNNETVLVVADDEAMSEVTCGILRREGYRVLVAANAGEALILCEQHVGNIDVLLTDLALRRISGRQLAERLAKLRPEMSVLYMAGFSDDETLQRDIVRADVDCIPKPITPAALGRKVRDVVARARANRGDLGD